MKPLKAWTKPMVAPGICYDDNLVSIEESAVNTVGCYRADTNGRIVWCNKVFLEIVGFDSVDSIPERKVSLLRGNGNLWDLLIQRITKEQKGVVRHSVFVRDDGTTVPVIEHVMGICGGGEEIREIFGIVIGAGLNEERDRAKEFEAILTQSAITAGIAHDLRNLMGLYMVAAGALDKYRDKPEAFDQTLEILVGGIRHGANLLQIVSKVPYECCKEPETVNLNTILTENVQIMRSLLSKRISLQLNLESNLPNVGMYPSEAFQIVLNLCVNARDAICNELTRIDRQCYVRMSTRLHPAVNGPIVDLDRLQDIIELVVEDNGPGIKGEILEQVRRPFFTTKENRKGRGIGLMVVERIVKRRKGLTLVDSAHGHGTTFRIFLPAERSQ